MQSNNQISTEIIQEELLARQKELYQIINRINKGIAEIDDHLVSSLAKNSDAFDGFKFVFQTYEVLVRDWLDSCNQEEKIAVFHQVIKLSLSSSGLELSTAMSVFPKKDIQFLKKFIKAHEYHDKDITLVIKSVYMGLRGLAHFSDDVCLEFIQSMRPYIGKTFLYYTQTFFEIVAALPENCRIPYINLFDLRSLFCSSDAAISLAKTLPDKLLFSYGMLLVQLRDKSDFNSQYAFPTAKYLLTNMPKEDCFNYLIQIRHLIAPHIGELLQELSEISEEDKLRVIQILEDQIDHVNIPSVLAFLPEKYRFELVIRHFHIFLDNMDAIANMKGKLAESELTMLLHYDTVRRELNLSNIILPDSAHSQNHFVCEYL